MDDTVSENKHNSSLAETRAEIQEGSDNDLLISDAEKKNKEEVEAIELPSAVSDREEIFVPHDILIEDPSIYGKWLIFTNGNLKLQDDVWIKLQNLLKNGDLILLASSTAKLCNDRGPNQGVIKCYTCKDINVIKRSGLAIQRILNDHTILDYKTNQASFDNLFRASGNRFISKFMLTANGKLYIRDELCRWKQITETEYHNYTFEENEPERHGRSVLPPAKKLKSNPGSDLLPSQETSRKKKRYTYPNNARASNYSGFWCLFCSIADTDDNGLTELDRAWKEAKALCNEGMFKYITCETYALSYAQPDELPRRTVMCELDNYLDIDRVIKSAEKLREKISYNFPMYFKMCSFNQYGKFKYQLKYLYTEDRELYEYSEDKFQLLTAT